MSASKKLMSLVTGSQPTSNHKGVTVWICFLFYRHTTISDNWESLSSVLEPSRVTVVDVTPLGQGTMRAKTTPSECWLLHGHTAELLDSQWPQTILFRWHCLLSSAREQIQQDCHKEIDSQRLRLFVHKGMFTAHVFFSHATFIDGSPHLIRPLFISWT